MDLKKTRGQHTLTEQRDTEWVLAMAEALGADSGYKIPIVPDAQAFRELFNELRRRVETLSRSEILQLEKKLSKAQWQILLCMKGSLHHGVWETPGEHRTFSVLERLGLIQPQAPGIFAAEADRFMKVTRYWGLTIRGELFLFRSDEVAKQLAAAQAEA